MLRIGEDVVAALQNSTAAAFVTDTVADWYAIYEQVSGRPAAMPFDYAAAVARLTVDRLNERSRPVADGAVGQLIHCQLLFLEHGGDAAAVADSTDHFLEAMPSDEAAMILVRAELGL